MKIYLLKSEHETDEGKKAYSNEQQLNIENVRIDSEDYWEQLIDIVEKAEIKGEDMVILCTNEKLLEKLDLDRFVIQIEEAKNYNTKILLANASSIVSLLPISLNLFWIDHFTDCELMVIFRSCYVLLTNGEDIPDDRIDDKLSKLTSNKLLVYPMVSDDTLSISSRKLSARTDRLMNQKKIIDDLAGSTVC